jgi:hypothetical protein
MTKLTKQINGSLSCSILIAMRTRGCNAACIPLMQHVQGYPGSHWTPPSGNYTLRIAPAAARATGNETMTKICTHFAGHIDGCGGVLVRYCSHHPIEEVQGFTTVEATGCPLWASILANRCNWSHICQFLSSFFIINL